MRIARFALVIVVLTLLPNAVQAATRPNEAIGLIRGSGSLIQWQPVAAAEAITLTVSTPDGTVITRQFSSGSPVFRVQDLDQRVPLDGVYVYELRLIPKIDASVREKLAAARASGDDAAIEQIRKDAGLHEQVIQSGSFAIRNGSIVPTDGEETPHAAAAGAGTASSSAAPAGGEAAASAKPPFRAIVNDQVIADDLIVQGSTCVGLDCVNNESFGFDTLRLKENNTRIKFQDTSTSPGFPAENWQLTANDSSSGGLSKFSIDDITASTTPMTIVANAPTNSLWVASSGKVGFRTATPVLDLHMLTGDTPAIRFDQNSSGGFTAQTWDVAGNEANFFVRDVTGGSRLPFRIRPGAPTSSIDIAATGFVGIGTPSPQRKLHIVGAGGPVASLPAGGPADAFVVENNANANFALVAAAGSGSFVKFFHSGGTSASGYVAYDHSVDALMFASAGSERMRINASGFVGLGGLTTPTNPIQHANGAYLSAGGVWTDASSRSLKRDISDISTAEAEEALKDLQPVKYAYKADPDERHVGFIAEDVPGLVARRDRKSLSPMDIVAVLTKVVQEQQKTIDELTKKVELLEARVK